MVRAPPPRLVLSAVGSTIALAQLSTAGERSRRPLKSAPPGRGRICLTRHALSSVRELVLTTAHIPQVSMAESAADRKARLKALRASRDGGDDGGGDAKKLKFRNYLPQSEALSANFEAPASLPKPDLGDDGAAARPGDDDDDDDDGGGPAAKKPDAPSAFEAELARIRAEDTEAVSVVPKDPNWDLKRDIEPKLAILRKRTQKAIVATLRERLKKESR